MQPLIAKPSTTIEKPDLWSKFLLFWASDSVALANTMAINVFILFIWSVISTTTEFYTATKGWWALFPMLYTVACDSLGASFSRAFWRFAAACLSCVVAILATLPDYGTNPWSVAIWGILLFSFYGWIAAFAPEFVDVTTVGGFTYMYVVWVSYGSAPNPDTFTPGKTAGIRLAWVTLGILLGLMSFLVSRPKYARNRVRQRLAKVLMDVQSLIKIALAYAQDPSKFSGDIVHDQLIAALRKASLDLESARADLSLAKTEPNVVYPWSSNLFEEMHVNLQACVSRLISINNLYRWLGTKFDLAMLAQSPNPNFFGPGRIEKLEDWCRSLAVGLYDESMYTGQGDQMRELMWNMTKETDQFRKDLSTGVMTEGMSPEAKELFGKLGKDELAIRARLSNAVALLICVLTVHLGIVEDDIKALSTAATTAAGLQG